VLGPVAQRGRPLFRAVGARVTDGTLTPETAVAPSAGGHARPAVGARRLYALVDVPAAVFAAEPGPAPAPEVVLQVLASTAVGARLGHAVVHHALAQVAHVPGHALAPVTVGLRLARSPVQAGVLLAVVGQMAVGPGEPGSTLARVTGTVFARHARRSVPARVRLTVVGGLVARGSGKPDRAMAHVPVAVVVVVATGSVVRFRGVDASAAVSARRTRAGRLRGRLASDALPLAGT